MKGSPVPVFTFNAKYEISVKAAPSRYLCFSGLRSSAGKYIREYADRALIIGGNKALEAVGQEFWDSLEQSGVETLLYRFTGEVCEEELKVICDRSADFHPGAVVGVGGGKALDIAKLAADYYQVPSINMPTIAATCAAVTPMSVLYYADSTYRQDAFIRSNPTLILIDPDVIAAAPVRYLKAGILDAIAKWYEGSASIEGSRSISDIFDESALKIAHMLYVEMNKNVEKAIIQANQGIVGTELLSVIHLNIYFAGMIQSLGVKAVRNGIAHSVHNGLTMLKESHALLHGLKVGYGIYVQLAVLKQQQEMLDEALDFFKKLQFIPSFKELNLTFSKENVQTVAEKTYSDPMMRKIPFDTITLQDLIDAMYKIEGA